jgi:hypothetical protein
LLLPDTLVCTFEQHWYDEVIVKYKDGEKRVLIEKDTPIVGFAAGDKSDIKPGARIITFAAAKQPDGSLTDNRINVGRAGRCDQTLTIPTHYRQWIKAVVIRTYGPANRTHPLQAIGNSRS